MEIKNHDFNYIFTAEKRKKEKKIISPCLFLGKSFTHIQSGLLKIMVPGEGSLDQVEPTSEAHCYCRKWMHCVAGNSFPHCFPGTGLCGNVCQLAHTAAIVSSTASYMQLWTLVPGPVLGCGISLQKELCEPHTTAGPCFSLGMSCTFQHSSFYSAKNNKKIGLFAVCNSRTFRGESLGEGVSNLYKEPSFTTFWPKAGNGDSHMARRGFGLRHESLLYKVLLVRCHHLWGHTVSLYKQHLEDAPPGHLTPS